MTKLHVTRIVMILAVVAYSMFLVKWVPIFSKQTWILTKSSNFIESPFSRTQNFSKEAKWSPVSVFLWRVLYSPDQPFSFRRIPILPWKNSSRFCPKVPILSNPHFIENVLYIDKSMGTGDSLCCTHCRCWLCGAHQGCIRSYDHPVWPSLQK